MEQSEAERLLHNLERLRAQAGELSDSQQRLVAELETSIESSKRLLERIKTDGANVRAEKSAPQD